MRIFTSILLLLLILVGITFAILNAEPVSLHFYFGQSQLPLSLLLVLALTVGWIIGMIICGIFYVKLKGENYRIKSRIKIAEKEIDNLRAIPIQDPH